MLQIQKNLTNSFFAILSLPATAMGFALSVQIAALSWLLDTKYGLDIHEIGFVWAAGPLAGIFGQVIIGVISDNVWFWNGRRRPFILIGGTIAAMMLLALPFIDVINDSLGIDSLIAVALVVALTLDLAINISFNPTRSLIADVTPQGDTRTRGYTWMQTISGFFGVCAYLIGALVSNYFLIYSGAVLVLLFSILPTLFIEEPRQLSATEEDGVEETKTNTAEFLKICFAHAFTWLGVQTMFIYTYAYIKEVIMGFQPGMDLTTAQSDSIGTTIGIAFAILNTVGFILPALVLEPIAKKLGRVRTHMFCIAIMAIGYALLTYFGNSISSLYLFMAIVGVGWAAVVSLPFAIMSEVVNQAKMGLFMGLFNLSVVIPQLFASGLGTYIQEQADKSVIYTISAIALGISAVLWLLVKENQQPMTSMTTGGGH